MSFVIKNKYQFYSASTIPTQEELKSHYEKYYEDSLPANYQHNYSMEELKYFNNKIEQRYQVLNEAGVISSLKENSILDVGCGEGISLNFFKNKGWNVLGLDFTIEGCKLMNPSCVEFVIPGDISLSIDNLIEKNKEFTVIWIDNVLEHVVDPLELLLKCKKLLKRDGMVVIEVPNDFSIIQNHLLEHDHIDHNFWVVIPEHLSYFNKDGLINLLESANFKHYRTLGDYPIDVNLFNENTNYVMDKTVGKSVHNARVKIENLLHEQSIIKTNNLYEAMADIGIGRSLISFFKTSE